MFKIADGRECFYQWDLDRQVVVEDSSVVEVHFCNRTDECSLVVEVINGLANVPNILLQTNYDIRVFGYDGKATRFDKKFKVYARTKPADYAYTETEIKNYETLKKLCYEVLDEAKELARCATGGKSFMTYQEFIDDLNAANQTEYYSPQHFFIKTMNVPDIWVYEVSEEYVPYEYVDDDTFAQALTDSTVQVGYYVLSALETQKVNLTDYVKNEEIDTKLDEAISNVNATLTDYATKEDLDSKVSTKDTALILYGTNASGQQTTWALRNTNNSPNTVAGRDSNGNIQVKAAVNDSDAVNKKYLEEAISNKLTLYDWNSDEPVNVPLYIRGSRGLNIANAPDGSGKKVLGVAFANDTQVKGQKETVPFSTNQISLAVRAGLTEPKVTWTDDEKALARETLGITSGGDIPEAVDKEIYYLDLSAATTEGQPATEEMIEFATRFLDGQSVGVYVKGGSSLNAQSGWQPTNADKILNSVRLTPTGINVEAIDGGTSPVFYMYRIKNDTTAGWIYYKEKQISIDFATTQYVDEAIANIDIPEGGTTDLTNYYTKDEVNALFEGIATAEGGSY